MLKTMLNAYQPPNKTPNKAVFFKSFEISIDPAAALTVDDALETVVFPRFCFSLNNDTALLLLEDNEVELEKEEVGNRIVPLDEVIVIEETAAAAGVRTHRLEDAAVVVMLRVVARMFTACAESVWVVANIFFCYVVKRYGAYFILFLPCSLTCFREILARVRKEEEEPTLFCCILNNKSSSSLLSCLCSLDETKDVKLVGKPPHFLHLSLLLLLLLIYHTV